MSAITVQDSINKIDQIKKGNTTYDVVDSNARTAIGEAYKKPTNGIPLTDMTNTVQTTVNSAVTSSTTGLKIEIVTSMPANPDANTVYIVR